MMVIPKFPRCVSCTYGRRPDSICDVHGTKISSDFVCRTYREVGENHASARNRHPLLNNLKPGIIYSVKTDSKCGAAIVHGHSTVQRVNRAEPITELGIDCLETREIQVKNIDDSLLWGRIDLYSSGLLILSMKDVRYGGQDSSPFCALKQIRLKMENDGRIPLVNGVNRNACLAGCSMGEGAFVHLWNADGTKDGLIVPTLENGAVTDPVYVHEQDAAFELWLNKQKNQLEA